MKRGNEAKHDTGDEARPEGEQQDGSIEPDTIFERKDAGLVREENPRKRQGKQQAEQPAQQREHEAFGDLLLHQTAPAGAERRAHRDFAFASRGAHE